MAFTTADIGKTCPFCGAGIIKQYSTGKCGCDKYCWKDNTNTSSKVYAPKVESSALLMDELGLIRSEIAGINERLDEIITKLG